jgi:molecular chaperone IbpA
MTKTLSLRSMDIPQLTKFGIGFDNIFDEILRVNAQQSNINYPPYDIVQINENEFMINVAVAGFGANNLTVTKEKNCLIIEGVHCRTNLSEPDATYTFLHKGISERTFRREFRLADYVQIENVTLELGILNVHLKREVPEEQKPKQFAIKQIG